MTPDERTALAIQLSALAVQVTTLVEKMDAIHVSLKEDLSEIKKETKETNGRVSEHDRDIYRLKGGLTVIAAGLPVVTGLLIFALNWILA
jgi:hypothetical protein